VKGKPWLVLSLAMVASSVLGLLIGATPIAPGDVWSALWGAGDSSVTAIVRGVRLPRVCLGVLVGASLGMSGSVMQGMLRNPLAEPYLLGVSGGAAVGAVLAVAVGVSAPLLIALAAFGGALGAVTGELALARTVAGGGGAGDSRVLLMAGVVVGAFANAAIMVVMATAAPDVTRNALWWMMGSVAAAGWRDVALLALMLLVVGAAVLHRARQLDVLALGSESAEALGVTEGRSGRWFFLLASLLAATTVAVAGLVGFVGLMVPHLARSVVGARTRLVLVAAALAGGALVVVADLAARTVRAPAELPLGAVTALLGVPFFLWRLRRAT